MKRQEKCELKDKIIQFGEGGFLRGFVDWMIDKLNKEAGFNGGVTVVQPIAQGMVDKLNRQDGLYTLLLRGLSDGEPVQEKTIIECIKRGVNPYTDWEGFLELAHNPDTRFIVSNTTEAGIVYKNEPMQNAPDLTYPGKLTLLLKERFDKGLGGFIMIPCELIDKNGEVLRKCVLQYIAQWELGDDFKNWVETENHFTSTLVDRIVTGYPRDEIEELQKQDDYTDELYDTAEVFHLWVIQGDKKLAEEIPFHKIGLNVLWTEDVTPYKMRKVRILNGAHTMMVLAAHLAGLETVGEAMEDDVVSEYMVKGIFGEIIPTLDLPTEELEQFAFDVLERFANPFIKHYLLSIALNSVSKFKVRVLPSILEYKERKGEYPKILVFSLAALIAFYRTDAANDDKDILTFMKTASVDDILAKTEYWDADLTPLAPMIKENLKLIETKGMREAIKEVSK